MKDGYYDACVRNTVKMKAEHDTQLQATQKGTPLKSSDFYCRVVPARLPDEQERRREKLCNLLAELKIDLISVRSSIRHQVMSILARGLDAGAVDDDDTGINDPDRAWHRDA